mgnify:CR=1 FL=1
MNKEQYIVIAIAVLCLIAVCAAFTVLILHLGKQSRVAIEAGEEDESIVNKALKKNSKGVSIAKKTFIVLGRVLAGLIIGASMLAAVFSVYVKVSGNRYPLGDETALVIGSGSMSKKNPINAYLSDEKLESEYDLDNQFDTYSTILIEKYAAADEVKLYDVVAYTADDGRVIVHRIVDLVEDSTGSVVGYITRGDANIADDTGTFYASYLRFDDLVGKYSGQQIPAVGYAVVFFQSPAGIATVLALLYIFIISDIVADRNEKVLNRRKIFLLSTLNIEPNDIKNRKFQDIERLEISGRTYSFKGGILDRLED